MESLIEYLEAELVRRSWRQADLARAAQVPDATIHHILNGSRRAGPEVCNALARALDEPPERIFRLAGLLPPLPPRVDEEQEAVHILRHLSPDLRAAAMRMLRGLRPGGVRAASSPRSRPTVSEGDSADGGRDPYLEVLEQLWDKAPDWKKKDIAAQIRATVEDFQREQDGTASRPEDGRRVTRQGEDEARVTRRGEDEGREAD